MENEKIPPGIKWEIIVLAINGMVVFSYFVGAHLDASDLGGAFFKTIVLTIAIGGWMLTRWWRKRSSK